MRMAISPLAGACTFSSWVLWGHEGRQSEQVFWADIAVLFGEREGVDLAYWCRYCQQSFPHMVEDAMGGVAVQYSWLL